MRRFVWCVNCFDQETGFFSLFSFFEKKGDCGKLQERWNHDLKLYVAMKLREADCANNQYKRKCDFCEEIGQISLKFEIIFIPLDQHGIKVFFSLKFRKG